MRSGLSSDSSYEERPSLGASVEAVLAGWRNACEHCTAPGQHVRALLTLGEDNWEFCVSVPSSGSCKDGAPAAPKGKGDTSNR